MADVRETLREIAPPSTGTVDVDAIRARSRVLTRRRRAVQGAAGIAVAALAVGLPLRALVDDGPDDAVRAVDGPEQSATTTTTSVQAPSTTATTPAAPPTTAPAQPGGVEPASPGRTRILTDVRGDVTTGGFGGQTAPADPSLDILALDLELDDESMTLLHQLDGSPSRPPEGADGRIHTTNFQVPGHDRVQVFVQTLRRDVEITIGVIKPGFMGSAGAQRCRTCILDLSGNRFSLRIPLDVLNDVMREGGAGQIESGTELTNWHITSGRNWTTRNEVDERESPHYYAADQADDIFNADYTYRVP